MNPYLTAITALIAAGIFWSDARRRTNERTKHSLQAISGLFVFMAVGQVALGAHVPSGPVWDAVFVAPLVVALAMVVIEASALSRRGRP